MRSIAGITAIVIGIVIAIVIVWGAAAGPVHAHPREKDHGPRGIGHGGVSRVAIEASRHGQRNRHSGRHSGRHGHTPQVLVGYRGVYGSGGSNVHYQGCSHSDHHHPRHGINTRHGINISYRYSH